MARLHPAIKEFAIDPLIDGFMEEFQRETDRAAAVLGPALLDEKLRLLLDGALVERSSKKKLLGVMQPLGPFGPRIYAAEALGLISADEASDLHRVREIRNVFAHQLHGLSFEEEKIAQSCNHFRCVKAALGSNKDFADTFTKSSTSRHRFNFAVALIAMALSTRVSKVKPFTAAKSPF